MCARRSTDVVEVLMGVAALVGMIALAGAAAYLLIVIAMMRG